MLRAWDGVVLADLPAARREACLIARDFMDQASGRLRPAWDGWWIEVRDEQDDCLLDMPLALAGVEGLTGRRPSGARLGGESGDGATVLYLTPRNYQARPAGSRDVEAHAALALEYSVTIDRHRFARNSLRHAVESARETVRQTRQLVAVSRALAGRLGRLRAAKRVRPGTKPVNPR
jgi:hypothetical protein